MTVSIKQSLLDAKQRLRHVDNAQLDAEVLLCYVIKKPRSALHARPEAQLSASEDAQYRSLIECRANGEPVAYLIGQQEFWSLPLAVDRHTLIPRPETELLVDTALAFYPSTQQHITAIDLGTGSGCIALALARERPAWTIYASDRSQQALQCARHNAQHLQLQQIKFIHSDWFAAIAELTFDLVVSNPPYIAIGDPHLQQGDLRFEPHHALVAGVDGLDAVRTLLQQSLTRLNSGGRLLLEIGYDQAERVQELAARTGYRNIDFKYDLAGIRRVFCAQRS